MKTDKQIWILEDDRASRFVLEEILALRYTLHAFESVKALRAELHRDEAVSPDLLIADLRLPDDSFLTLLGSEEDRQLLTFPFLVVSSVDDLDALRQCYSLGAADYLTKPFGKAELIVKVERLLAGGREAGPRFKLDPITFRLQVGDRASDPLTQKEFQILSLVLKGPGTNRDQVISTIWEGTRVESKTLDVHLSSLRKKLGTIGLGIHFKPNGALELQPE